MEAIENGHAMVRHAFARDRNRLAAAFRNIDLLPEDSSSERHNNVTLELNSLARGDLPESPKGQPEASGLVPERCLPEIKALIKARLNNLHRCGYSKAGVIGDISSWSIDFE